MVQKYKKKMIENVEILDIIEQYPSLKLGFKFIVRNSTSNYAGYHNFTHMLNVTKHCYLNLKYSDMLGDENVENLLLTALFHDVNHSMGKFKDDVNIIYTKEAISLFFFNELPSDVRNSLNYEFILETLNATQFPYIISNEDLTIYQAMIRDADLMQIIDEDYIQRICFGLSEELNLDIDIIIAGTIKFHEEAIFNTEYGVYMKDKYYEKSIDKIKRIKELLS